MEHRHRRRRQPRTACDVCRRRKTKCDVAHKFPCSVCAKSRLLCRTTTESPPEITEPNYNLSVSQDGGTRHVAAPEGSRHNNVPNETSLTEAPSSHPGPGSSSADNSPAELRSIVTERDRVIDGLARSGLKQFYRRGVDSAEWAVFADSEHIRLAYIGTATSNIAHLISLKRFPTPTLHFPYPPIRPPLPWRPEGVWGPLGNLDIARDMACFPDKIIRDALVDAFFEKIYPGFPVVEESAFRRGYADPSKPPPLLLFQAVLLAGSHVCDHPMVAASRMVVKRTLFRRASMLFHIRHENDRIYLVQAALLFSWHLENSDTVSAGSYYWLGLAQRMAFGMGMHRNLSVSAGSRLPGWERLMYRRLWWTMVQAEVFSCLEHGRPCMINTNDMDQPPLELRDFAEGETETINGRVQFDYLTQNIKLSLIGLRVLQLTAPSLPSDEATAMISSIETSLADFAFDLPSMNDFWSCQLRMHYNLVLLHLHRSPSFNYSLGSHEIRSDASQAILSCLETIINRGWICQCAFTAVSALMAAAMQMSLDAQSSLNHRSSLLALNAQDRLARLLHCARELESFWPTAGAVYSLFDELSDELKAMAKRTLSGRSSGAAAEQVNEAPIDWAWDHALEAFDFAAAPADLMPSEWISTELPWPGLQNG